MNRTENGLTLSGTNVVAADLIGKLSGVSGKDVARVLVAIHAVAGITSLPVAQIVDYAAIPNDGADDTRFVATENYVYMAIHRLQKADLRYLAADLRIHKRFSAPRPAPGTPPTLRAMHAALGRALATTEVD